VIHNGGTLPAADVRVQDELPPAVRFLGAEPRPEVQGQHLLWSLGRLAPGGERRLRVEVQAPAVRGEWPCAVAVAYVAAGVFRVASPASPTSRLSVTVTGPDSALLGQPVVFQIRLANESSAPLTGLVLRDRLSAGLQHPQGHDIEADLGALAPGETKTIQLTTTAIQIGRQVNEVTVTGDGHLSASAQTTVQVAEPARDVIKQAVWKEEVPVERPAPRPRASASALRVQVLPCDRRFAAGKGTLCEVWVMNEGPTPVTGLHFLAAATGGMEIQNGKGPTPYRVDGQGIDFQALPQLPPKEQAVFRLRLVGVTPGESRLQIQLSTDQVCQPVFKEEPFTIDPVPVPGGAPEQKLSKRQ
jgi:uncharacterized repeat protein (TIGR01451 family)